MTNETCEQAETILRSLLSNYINENKKASLNTQDVMQVRKRQKQTS